MLTVPMFGPWRPIWDTALHSKALRMDELALERRRGRLSPPEVKPEVIRSVASARVQVLLHDAVALPTEEVFAVLVLLRPLIGAAVWPRWLLLEATLEEASVSGGLHLAALALRTQIEELDALQEVGKLVTLAPQMIQDADFPATAIEVLRTRILPRTAR